MKSSSTSKKQEKEDSYRTSLVHVPTNFDFSSLNIVFAEMVVFCITLINLSIWGIPPLNGAVKTSYNIGGALYEYGEETFGALGNALEKDKKIFGYRVTSEFGYRDAPCENCSTFHKGTDLATPTGVAVHVPARPANTFKMDHGEKFKARCRKPSETGGGGLVLELLMVERGVMYQVLHLSHCGTAMVSGGEVIAKTGGSGNGTGPHVDFRKIITAASEFDQVDKSPENFVPITEFEVRWFLSGQRPKPVTPWEVE